MKTLAQIRAANALEAAKVPGIGAGQREGNVLSDFPMLIKTSGALAAFAYAVEPKADEEDLDQLAEYLAGRRLVQCRSARRLLDEVIWLEPIRIAQLNQEAEACFRDLGDERACARWNRALREKGFIGLLAVSLRKHPGEFLLLAAIARHLRYQNDEGRIAITTSDNADALVTELATSGDDSQLRRATAETIAFLNYLKRFVA